MFHISIWGAWYFVWAKPTIVPRGDGTASSSRSKDLKPQTTSRCFICCFFTRQRKILFRFADLGNYAFCKQVLTSWFLVTPILVQQPPPQSCLSLQCCCVYCGIGWKCKLEWLSIHNTLTFPAIWLLLYVPDTSERRFSNWIGWDTYSLYTYTSTVGESISRRFSHIINSDIFLSRQLPIAKFIQHWTQYLIILCHECLAAIIGYRV